MNAGRAHMDHDHKSIVTVPTAATNNLQLGQCNTCLSPCRAFYTPHGRPLEEKQQNSRGPVISSYIILGVKAAYLWKGRTLEATFYIRRCLKVERLQVPSSLPQSDHKFCVFLTG